MTVLIVVVLFIWNKLQRIQLLKLFTTRSSNDGGDNNMILTVQLNCTKVTITIKQQ